MRAKAGTRGKRGSAERWAGLLGWLLTLGAVGGGLSAVPSGGAIPVPAGSVPINATVAPATSTLEAGESVTLTASWSGSRPSCTVLSERTDWSLDTNGSELGWLNSTHGVSVVFASTTAGGTARVTGTVTVDWFCFFEDVTDRASATASIRVLAPLTVGNVTVWPNPATPGALVTMSWVTAGGAGPYEEEVSLGDGTNASLIRSVPGSASLSHRYAAGLYLPEIHLTDALGADASASPTESLEVAFGLAVAIESTVTAADPRTPIPFWPSISGGLPPYRFYWSDGNTFSNSSFGFTPIAPGNGTVSVELTVEDGSGQIASARRSLPVVPLPALAVFPLRSSSDAGVPLPASLRIVGGVPPFRLSWEAPEPQGANLTRLTADGAWPLALTFPTPGEGWASVGLTDALGVTASFAASLALIYPSPQVLPGVTPGEAEAALAAPWSALVTAGAPPLDWAILSSLPLSNESGLGGSLDGSAMVHGNLTFAVAGNTTVLVTVWDSAGKTATWNLSVAVAPSLSVDFRANGSANLAGETLELSLAIASGLPPYTYVVSLSDGEIANGTLASAGTGTVRFVPLAPGILLVHCEVTDALGASRTVALEVAVTAASPSSPARSTGGHPPVLAFSDYALPALLALLVLGAVGGFWWYRRGTRRRTHAPDGSIARALEVVRSLLLGREGIDEETLVLLAEDQGVDEGSVDRALEEWSRQGRIERGEDATLGRVFRWKGEVAPVGSPEAAPATGEDG